MNEDSEARSGNEFAYSITPSRRRRPRRRRHVYSKPIGKLWIALLYVVVIALIVGGLRYQYFKIARFTITLNKTPLVATATRTQAEDALRQLKMKYAPVAPQIVTFTEGELAVVPITHPMPTMDTRQAVDELDKHVTAVLNGAAIYVNRKPMVLLPSKAEAAEAISLMMSRGAKGKQGLPTFAQRVTIVMRQQTAHDKFPLPLYTAQQAAAFFVHDPVPTYHSVVAGDSFWSISNAHGLTVPDIEKLNPEFPTHILHLGDKVRLPDTPSPVTIIMKPAQPQ